MKKNIIFLCYFIVIVSIPIAINYGLLSWRAPGVNGDGDDWLGFFANFLGLIGAVSIALFQFKKQREQDEKKDIENNRTYVDVKDFRSTMMLVGVKTHENSRIILTEGYEALKKENTSNTYKTMRVPYLKISHFGAAPIITNCEMKINLSYIHKSIKKTDEWVFFLASIEKDVEVFIPLVPKGTDNGTKIEMNYFTLNYTTVKGEELTLHRDYEKNTEVLLAKNNKELYKSDLKTGNWIYPNKMEHNQ